MECSSRTTAGDPRSSTSFFAGLDAVRAGAALAVVALHAGTPYLKHSMPGLTWSMRDASSPVVDFVFWSIELMIMPIFLVVAGFFAFQSLKRGTPKSLVSSRARRLLVPLAFGVCFILPLSLYSWVLGWVIEGWVAPVKLRSLKFDGVIDRDLWGLGHLWFLQYLFTYMIVLGVGAVGLDRTSAWRSRLAVSDAAKRIAAIPRRCFLVAAWITVAATVLWFRPNVVWGFQHAFFPVPSKWLYHGLFFAVGVALARVDPKFAWLKSVTPRLAAPAALLAAMTVLMGQWHLAGTNTEFAAAPLSVASGLADLTLAVMTASAALASTLAVIGLAVTYLRRNMVAVQYLAAASFWVYLVHHPILSIVHIDLKWLTPGLAPAVKASIACAVAIGLSLATFEVFARKTRLGRLLGFDWTFPSNEVSDSKQSNDRDTNSDFEREVISIEFTGRSEPPGPSEIPSSDGISTRRAA
ncbi:glucans biosynthesis protein [Rubripirellula tenax]|uniref:Glucans biosynthesis protein n=1 Tax=Rubripirellula tenax TaxID=2528015 RepID=A0A5C6ECU5_9BACT|nr:acyltransferase [Rubripirellula tenax]TWU46305.1 glucans biosynthesis protein [Rubripirellula tenax]